MELKKNVKNENGTCELEFAIDAAAFNEAVSKVFKKTASKYKVAGFRPGKAPRNIIEQMYGKDVFTYDAINELFPANYEAAVREAGIDPVDRPEVDIVSADAENGVVLKAIVTVKPEVALGEYKGLKAEKTVHTVEAATVDAEIDRMRERNARIYSKEEGNAENGDTAVIDFEGFIDDVAFEGGKGEKYPLELGSGQFIPGFEEQVVGHAVGEEFDVVVPFPADYAAEELAGKTATFKIKLHEVKAKELPAADDEFAKDVSEYDTLAELRASIEKEMKEQLDRQSELEAENQLVDQVVTGMKAEIPECMIRDAIDDMVRDFEYRMESQGLKLENYLQYTQMTMEKFREGFKDQAEKQVKMRLALEKIVALENIEATEEEFEAEISRIAANYKLEAERVKAMIPTAEVKKDLAINKAIDFIKSNATITEVENKKAAE
ncbi:trigger factor [Pygmaiobacter massiliensis]|uniref:trigger factor n=1 Tax=Pygmaiobacter massiliensis TaxID=1917873 RepID=UPI002896E2A5|nr:trigger factor [Pygmaiobacter massiliensis]